jgi:anti-sigma B factor antagonist
MLKVNVVKNDPATVVQVDGEVDLYSSSQVRKVILNLIEIKSQLLVIDLDNVEYIDSSGVATLVEGLQEVKKYDGRFILANLSEEVKSVFELSRLDKVFEIYASLEDAIKNL